MFEMNTFGSTNVYHLSLNYYDICLKLNSGADFRIRLIFKRIYQIVNIRKKKA